MAGGSLSPNRCSTVVRLRREFRTAGKQKKKAMALFFFSFFFLGRFTRIYGSRQRHGIIVYDAVKQHARVIVSGIRDETMEFLCWETMQLSNTV